MKDNTLLRVLSIKPFLFLWLAEVFSQIAMNMANFILIVLAFKLTNSSTAVSGVVVAFTLPAILVGIVAGAYVDHWNKKKVLNVTNILRALFVLVLFFFPGNLLLMYLVTFATSVVTQFFIPAETPMIPVLVKKNLLLSANALFGMGIYGSMLVAYALSGPSLLFFGEKYVFIFLSILFVIASFFVNLIKYKGEEERESATAVHMVAEVRSALDVIRKTQKISYSLFLLTLSALLILLLAVVGPGYAKRILSITVEEFPLLFVAPAAFGMVIGALFLGNKNSERIKQNATTIGILLSSVTLFLLPFLSKYSLYILVVLALVLGIANALVFVPSNTILQEETTERMRGKMYGFLNAFVGAVSLLPIIVVGGLADVFGVGSVLVGMSGLLLLLGLSRIIHNKTHGTH